MDAMFLTSPAPFMAMATTDYSPYPMHTARDSRPRRRRNIQKPPTTSKSHCNGPTTSNYLRPTELGSKPKPKPVQRVDSGFDDASETSSVTFTEEVERTFALRQFLHQHHHDSEGEEGDEVGDEVGDDERGLARKARDSIDMNVERASTWEIKESRTKRNRKSKLKMVKKWFERLIIW